ncbi:MAG TPA: TIM-barrel domain-containing protein [Sphingomicrobium sp.]|jgi:alpha-glucosidase|nr:TIM-barrel domain-containing protein [Sphingomicrobium sp.]
MRAALTPVARVIALSLIVAASSAQGAQVSPALPGTTQTTASLSDGLQARRGPLLLRVTALTDEIVRVRIGRDGALPEDSSWAVLPQMRARHAVVSPLQSGFETGALRVTIDPASLSLTVADRSDKVIIADAGDPVSLDGRAFTLRKSLPAGEHIYGLGDKTGGALDRRGKTFVDWNTDAYGFDSSTDPIYKSIPFFIGVDGEGSSYGILLDNSWRTSFDFGHTAPNMLTIGGPDGPIDYYIIAGPSIRDVVRRYTDLTGKAPLPPEWALGYQQSRYSYMSGTEVRQIADTLRRDRIPTDVIWLDIDYQDRNRPFTVNSKTFPNLKGLADQLNGEGIKLVTITDLHVADAPNQGYAPYDTGSSGNDFVHNADGSVYVGKVWPGPSVFPDFTDARVRAWWGTNFKSFVEDGIAGFWNDMNEPSVFNEIGTMPLSVVHHIEGDDFAERNASHAEIHNIYGMENTRATYDGLRALRPDERAFVMTRASYAGGQRYAVTWTGDNSATWDHLRLMVHQLINLGLSGFSYGGADVGGFTGGPSPELMTRWFELAAFTPIFRDHSAKDTPRAEPWVDGPAQLAIRRKFVDERYRLLPYLYSLADLNSRTGDPIMRPVFYDYPDAAQAHCDQSMSFTLGAALLIAPPPKMESPEAYDVCLPRGGWYDYWTGKPVAGPSLSETPRLDYLPLFVRAGTILPRQSLVQSTSQIPDGPLRLDVYPGKDCRGVIYFDDGHSMRFQGDDYLRQEIRCSSESQRGTDLTFEPREGSYVPWWRKIDITVHRGSGLVRVSGSSGPIPSRYDRAAGTIEFEIGDMPRGGTIRLQGLFATP